MDLPDEQLVRGFLAGERVCFKGLVQRYQEPLLRLATRVTGNVATAEDVVQDTFMVAAQSLETLEKPGSVRAWLFRIAYRKGILHMKTLRRGPDTLSYSGDRSLEPIVEGPESTLHERSDREQLMRLVARLPERDQTCINLKLVDGCKCSEISQILDESIAAIRKRIWRAKKKLIGWSRGAAGATT